MGKEAEMPTTSHVVDITVILSPQGNKLGEIIKLFAPEGFQIFWKVGGMRSRIFSEWEHAKDAAEIYFPYSTFVRLAVESPPEVAVEFPPSPVNDPDGGE